MYEHTKQRTVHVSAEALQKYFKKEQKKKNNNMENESSMNKNHYLKSSHQAVTYTSN